MLRKYLFWGLTLVLIVALANLIFRARRIEKKQSGQVVETVEESKPSATRVLEPQDLRIVQSKMRLEPKTDGQKSLPAAQHEVEIFNGGNVAYRDIQLRFVYFGPTGKKLGTRTHSIAQTIQPGTSLKLANISFDNIPSLAANLQTTIAYADIASPAPSSK